MNIVMQGKSVHETVKCLRCMVKAGVKNRLRPVIIRYIGASTDLLDRFLWIIDSDIGLITPVEVSVVGRTHIATAAPVLISHAKVIHTPWFFLSVFLTQIRHRRDTVKCHIFHPFAHLLNGSAAHIAVHVGLTAQLLCQFEKFMGSKTVILNNTAPMGIDHTLTLLLRADSILPMIFIGKTSSRPAQHRHLNLF